MSLLDHFAPATKQEVMEQQQQIKISPPKPRLKRSVGRPKQLINVQLNCDQSDTNTSSSTNNAKRKYINWIQSPFVHDIIEAARLCKSARKAVEYLQNKHRKLPTENQGKFDGLSHSVIEHWFNHDWSLKDSIAVKIDPDLYLNKKLKNAGSGKLRFFSDHPDLEQLIKDRIIEYSKSADVDITLVKFIMKGLIQLHEPQLLDQYKLSKAFIWNWIHYQLQWRWRVKTSQKHKLPIDFDKVAKDYAKRIAATIKHHQTHKSLIINFDQTGIHLVPAGSHSFAPKGTKDVPNHFSCDKRQITAVIASSFDGVLLPIQLIFQGKTERCEPTNNDNIDSAGFHITHSYNHWSNQETMVQYIDLIIVPYVKQQIAAHHLPAESQVILILDCWSVHKSAEFRNHVYKKYKFINLVFVPANCTSELQVADYVLNRPFKHGITRRFNEWASNIILKQLESNKLVGLKEHLKMEVIKPMLLQWCYESWNTMKTKPELINRGWYHCVSKYGDPFDEKFQNDAAEEAFKGTLKAYRFFLTKRNQKIL